nr:DNA mismatch repair protein MutS, core [Tanacetum cinerariifolium]
MTNDEGDIDDIRSTEAEFDEDHQFLHLDYREIDTRNRSFDVIRGIFDDLNLVKVSSHVKISARNRSFDVIRGIFDDLSLLKVSSQVKISTRNRSFDGNRGIFVVKVSSHVKISARNRSFDVIRGIFDDLSLVKVSSHVKISKRNRSFDVIRGNFDDIVACKVDYCRLLSYVLPLYLRVIQDMEKLKHKLHEHIHEARYHLKLAREPHRNLVVSEHRIREHTTSQRYKRIQGISDGGGVARSLLHKKVRQCCAFPVLAYKADDSPLHPKMAFFSSQSTPKESDMTMASEAMSRIGN